MQGPELMQIDSQSYYLLIGAYLRDVVVGYAQEKAGAPMAVKEGKAAASGSTARTPRRGSCKLNAKT